MVLSYYEKDAETLVMSDAAGKLRRESAPLGPACGKGGEQLLELVEDEQPVDRIAIAVVLPWQAGQSGVQRTFRSRISYLLAPAGYGEVDIRIPQLGRGLPGG